MTEQAIRDFLAQTGLPSPPQVLAIDNGSTQEVRDVIDQWAVKEPRLHCWHHRPPMPSLSATWNAALDFVWGQGGEVALVVNNDVRVHPSTYSTLVQALADVRQPLFVSAVGRREPDLPWDEYFSQPLHGIRGGELGGPDFSCFLITREGHEKYPFDEGIVPCYTEDLDLHRRMMLGGDGERIFSINLPYLHYASGTINSAPPEQALAWSRRIDQARAYYARKWGGTGVNGERYTIPFDVSTDQDHVTTPELQAAILGGSHAPTPTV